MTCKFSPGTHFVEILACKSKKQIFWLKSEAIFFMEDILNDWKLWLN